jgi:1-acyl-sn-glycerol-3-phosphate acyltransferase
MIEEGPCIIAANHCSFLDPPLVGVACKRAIHYLARKSLLEWPILGPIFPELNVIPVDRKNADRSALMGAIRVVKNGGAVLIFPEGTRSPDGNLQPAQPGLGMIVAKTGAPVVPARIEGSHEAFARNRMLPRAKPISVKIGPAMEFHRKSKDKNRDCYQEISKGALEAIRNL